MSTEILSLYVFCITTFLTLGTQATILLVNSGWSYITSNREGQIEKNPLLGRLERAVRNSVESAVIFAPLILIAAHLDISNERTQWGAAVFAGARILYVISYALGLGHFRTLVWNVAMIAMGLVALGIVKG